jgi:hypothetical protein
VSRFEATRDAQRIYKELKKHALGSAAAQLSGDTLLQYITATRLPENWRGIAYGFSFNWKEQVMKYEKLELEDFPQVTDATKRCWRLHGINIRQADQ